MIFSAFNPPKYKFIPRNIQSSFIKDYKEKSFANKKKANLKHSNSLKINKNSHHFYNIKENFSVIDLEKSNNNNILSRNRQNNKDFSIQKGFSSLFDSSKIKNSIISKIDHLMSIYKYNNIKLYYSFIKIENLINRLLKKSELDTQKSLSSYNNKNQDKLNISNNENIDGENQEQEINLLNKKINKLMQKQNEIENKFKFERLSYLFCIGENQKEIRELHDKLKMLTINKMPKNELKKVVCFPNYAKFDITDEINPKSIPMFSSNEKKTQTPKIIQRNKSKKSTHDNNDFNQLFKTELRRYKHNISFSINESNKKDDNNKNDTLDYEKEEEERKISGKQNKLKNIDDTIELGKKYFDEHIPYIDRFFQKKKNYFLSHPKLNYIKDINSGNNIIRWKLGNQINSLPQQIAKLKTVSKSKKNTIVVFPSFLNETLLNIEKLKNNKNFRSIDNKFEDIYKIKLKSQD